VGKSTDRREFRQIDMAAGRIGNYSVMFPPDAAAHGCRILQTAATSDADPPYNFCDRFVFA
jgi:hypothetical protein